MILFADAKVLLDSCTRRELRDHAFGDTEVTWTKDGHDVGGGYFGRESNVWIKADDGQNIVGFEGMEALQLRDCGKEVTIFRNDETGPDTYTEGQTMPGLTKEAVLEELTTPRSD